MVYCCPFGVDNAFVQDCVVKALSVSILSGVISLIVKLVDQYADLAVSLDDVLPENEVYQSFSFLLGFFIVLQSSHAYQRLMHGGEILHIVVGELTELTNLLFSFTRTATSGPAAVREFKLLVLRLVSLLFCVSVTEVEEGHNKAGYSYKLIDLMGIDEGLLDKVYESDHQPEAVCHITYSVIVDGISSGTLTIAPPLLTRVFHDFSQAMIKIGEVRTFKDVPFPAPFVLSVRCLLFIQSVQTPLYMAHWTTGPGPAAVFTTILIFAFFILHLVSVELDNPFGHDSNDINVRYLQEDLNERLLSILIVSETDAERELDGASSKEFSKEYRDGTNVSFRRGSERQSDGVCKTRSASSRSSRTRSRGCLPILVRGPPAAPP
jgi:predicted membrane chloride channel (bestrophin family)